jgi:hypothetical protein
MRFKFFIWAILVFALLGTHRQANAEDPEDVLQRRVGTWITETTSRKAEWTPEAVTSKGEETIRWMLDKRVLMFEGRSNPNARKSIGLMAYDPQTKLYRSWFFDNNGVIPRSDTTGKWDADNNTLHLRSDLGDGNLQQLKLVYTSKDRLDWTMDIRNKDGRLMMDVFGHTTRKK